MKQSAAKTLGVATLGAAFAVAGAGAANAAPVAPDVSSVPGSVTRALPVNGVAKTLPDASKTLAQGEGVLDGRVDAVKPVTRQLVGGLPVKGLPTQALPLKGLPVKGLPVG